MRTPRARNARFYIYVNECRVKLTLKPGQSRHYEEFSRHDEGYHASQETWTHEGDVVRLDAATESTDCDGRHSDFQELECPISDLMTGRNGYGEPTPEWSRISAGQRDYTAEAAGY